MSCHSESEETAVHYGQLSKNNSKNEHDKDPLELLNSNNNNELETSENIDFLKTNQNFNPFLEHMKEFFKNMSEENKKLIDRSNDISLEDSSSTNVRKRKRRKLNIPRTNVTEEEMGCTSNDNSNPSIKAQTISSNNLTGKTRKMFKPSSSTLSKKEHLKILQREQEDDDTVSIPTNSDMDKKIEKLMNSESSSSSSSEEDDDLNILQKLKDEFLDDQVKGPAVDKELGDLFDSLKESGLSQEKVATKAKEYPAPENCDMDVRLVNPEIWSIISSKERNLDLGLQKSAKLITKASYALLKIADSAISARKKKKDRKKAIKDILKHSTDALAFITTANKNTEKIRRELIVKKLAYDQRSLGKNIPIKDKYLFGDNLQKSLQEVAGAKKLQPKKYKSFQQKQSYHQSKNEQRYQKAPRYQHKGHYYQKNKSNKSKKE